MPAVQRIGDANNLGGTITATPNSSVYANGVLIAVENSSVSGHPPNTGLHTAANCKTANGSSNVFIGGAKVITTNAQDNCAHIRTGGSPNVFVN
jgi:uncharacterized Zn-binding protein involved in type VI secretion